MAETEAQDMLIADNCRMREAGCKLAEAAMRVVREYDGVHRLASAVAEWSQAVADEGGRGQRARADSCEEPDCANPAPDGGLCDSCLEKALRETCPTCKGVDTIADALTGAVEPYTCPDCGGSGNAADALSPR
jgi:hypothetical protein